MEKNVKIFPESSVTDQDIILADESLDEYEEYSVLFDPVNTDRKARRRKLGPRSHAPKQSDDQQIEEIAQADALEGGFNTTYTPGRYEELWLLDSLRTFFDQALIADVLRSVKGGKEASVYCCAANPATGFDLLAAKVYRPRMFRTLRNDSLYRQGRDLLTAGGRAVKKTDHRIMRAIGKKTDFGVHVMQYSWLMHEFTSLQMLYEAGGAVPRPVAAGENAILMGYYGDELMAAPTLNEVDLDPDEAERHFREVVRNIELMVDHDLIHGDLSPYNMLIWDGELVIIDFPQVTHCTTNDAAYEILERDITRVREYFAAQGVATDGPGLLERLWARYAQERMVE